MDKISSPYPSRAHDSKTIHQSRQFRSRDKRLASAEEVFVQRFRGLGSQTRSTITSALDAFYAEYITYLRGSSTSSSLFAERMLAERHRLGEAFQYALTDMLLSPPVRAALTSVYHVMYASMTTCLAVVKSSGSEAQK